jgi:hypothetical protein
MFDVILDNYRKAAESTIKLQQEMLRDMASQWPQMFGSSGFGVPLSGGAFPGAVFPGADMVEQFSAAQKKWAETVTDMLNKHRESLDAQYRAGIRTIEDAFRTAEAKDPQQFRKLAEELWRHSFECLKEVAEAQMRDVQAVMQKWYEAAAKAAAGVKG